MITQKHIYILLIFLCSFSVTKGQQYSLNWGNEVKAGSKQSFAKKLLVKTTIMYMS